MIKINDGSDDRVKLSMSSAMLRDDMQSWFDSEEEKKERLQTGYSDEQKQSVTHHLILTATGTNKQISIIGSLVNDTSKLIGGASVEEVPEDRWDKKPYAFTRSSQSGMSTIPIYVATVDDLRLLLRVAEEHGIKFVPGHKQVIIDKAAQIIDDLGMGYK